MFTAIRRAVAAHINWAFDRRLQDKRLVAVGHARQAKLAGNRSQENRFVFEVP